ncbi:PfkB family carbohydrate kinase [Streptomyces aidingensis]|uniref:Fructokinase n=1 Tax=Streptomyces aidingensis TaxID=910347 RepID=A0A1I1RKU4_9ACTN|nr:PfkB family carbohydrate kinase [Streptomyces aidingensis]SFD34782.1 fructokinase [Streptomyces aidingensis]
MPQRAARVTVVGESLVDLLWPAGSRQATAVAGGSPANVAVGLHRLARPVTLVTCWGDDPPGELVAARLAETGVPVIRAPAATARTTVALACLDRDGSASYDFLATWDPAGLPVPEDTAVLHTGSLATILEPGAARVIALCEEQRARGRTVAADLNVRPAVQPDREVYLAACLRLAATADVLKASDEDLAFLLPGLAPAQAARRLLASEPSPALAVVTLGAAGALAVTPTGETHVPAPAVTVADTVGAGDAFQAALLDSLAAAGGSPPAGPDGLRRLLTRAARAAALTCTRTGPEPPTLADLESAAPGA